MADWLSERLAKFQELREKREDGVADNLASVKVEDVEFKKNPQLQARLERKKEKAEDYLAKEAASQSGVDLDRQTNLTYTIEENIAWREKLEEKERAKDPGYIDYASLTRRKYERLLDKINPNEVTNRKSSDSITAMAEDVKKERIKRLTHSKRRRHDESEDVTYINERNNRFNKKVARSYDKYTAEVQESLERGSAL